MAIHERTHANGTKYFYIYVVAKSKKNRRLKVQKEKDLIPNRKEAERWEKRLKNEAKEELLRREFDGDTWSAIVKKWKVELISGKASHRPITVNTINDYIFLIEEYTKEWNKVPIGQIKPADVTVLYSDLITGREKSGSTGKRMRSALNCVFNWAILQRKAKDNPVTGIPVKYNPEETRPLILTLTEIHKLLRESQALNNEWFEIWTVALLTGLRNGELHALLWNKVDLERKLLLVELSYDTKTRSVGPTKGRYWRQVPINDVLHDILIRLKAKTGHTAHVLPRMNEWDKGYQARRLREFCRQIGITPVKFHTLRACFATHLLDAGVSQTQVQKICGWKDSKTMDRYIRLAGTDIKDATKDLPIIPSSLVMAKVVDLFPK